MRQLISAIVVTVALAGSVACAGRIRVYDEPRHDYHRWNRGEERYYRIWLGERHIEYREFRVIDRRQQEEYWEWRHNHR
jgi:hypothetical protein